MTSVPTAPRYLPVCVCVSWHCRAFRPRIAFLVYLAGNAVRTYGGSGTTYTLAYITHRHKSAEESSGVHNGIRCTIKVADVIARLEVCLCPLLRQVTTSAVSFRNRDILENLLIRLQVMKISHSRRKKSSAHTFDSFVPLRNRRPLRRSCDLPHSSVKSQLTALRPRLAN